LPVFLTLQVVLVNATDDGDIEYTLAAHHYEAEESTHPEHVSNGRRPSATTARSDSSESECAPSFLASEPSLYEPSLSGRSVDDSDEEETRIDMDRLVPITAEGFHDESIFPTVDSDYHFVVNGKTWDTLYRCHPRSTLHRIIAKGTVYARMSPEWKMQLVESLQVSLTLHFLGLLIYHKRVKYSGKT